MSGHHHHHDLSDQSENNIAIAFFLNLTFTIIEFVGGFFTNSVSIMSDALHDLGDSITLGMAWYFQRLSRKNSDAQFSYGYKRFSVLGALIGGLVLLFGSIFIIFRTVPRLLDPQMPNAEGMMYLAIVGVFFNGIAAWRLSKGSSLNEEVVSLHLMEDVLGWVAVLIVSIVLQFYEIPILDAVLSLLIVGFILFNVFKSLKRALKIFLQAIPENISSEKVREAIAAISGVSSINDFHIWSLDGEYNMMTLNLGVSKALDFEAQQNLKKEVKEKMKQFPIQHLTIEIGKEEESCDL